VLNRRRLTTVAGVLCFVALASGRAFAQNDDDIVLYASTATRAGSQWSVVADATAAGGARLQSVNAGAAKVTTALASPSSYAELTFEASAGQPYRLWLRSAAQNDYWGNDSVHVQFSGSVNGSGQPVYRIGTTDSAVVNLEDAIGAGLSGWGWQDNGWGTGVLGPEIYFATTGAQTLRIQVREDGLGIDQVVLSAVAYLDSAPGALKNDTTILPASGGSEPPPPPPPPPGGGDPSDIVLYGSTATRAGSQWSVVADATAAGGARLQSVNAGAAKVTTALASPSSYAELTFEASAGQPYRLWLRSKAQNDYWGNDSVHVQFSGSVNGSGQPVYRIGTTDSAVVNLEDAIGAGLSGWGWQDNGWGTGVLGPQIYFATDGAQTLRIQVREDGLGIDQVVLSAVAYLDSAPGALKNDTTILPASGGGGTPPAITVVHAPYLQQVTSTSAVVVWTTRESGTALVRYRDPSGATGTVTATSTRYAASRTGMGDYYHHVARLSDLQPSTTYLYDVELNGADPFPGSDRRLATAPSSGTGAVTFIAFGDSGTGSAEQQQLAAVMNADSFDIALHAGDVAYGSTDGLGAGTHQTLTDWFFATYRGWLASAPMFPSLGNHDSRSANSDGRPYLDLFVLPENGGAGAYPDHAERYYSYDYGPAHFVALDTELAFQDPARRAEQLAWLEADLASSAAAWKIVYFHRSPFSAGGEHGSDLAVRQAFSPIFEKYGAQLVISAHEHTYERTKPWMVGTIGTPVTYIVTGGGGGPLYPAGTASWTAVSGSFHHYVRGTATTCTLTVEAIGIDGTRKDAVTLSRCGG
jgi:hypothetical protein